MAASRLIPLHINKGKTIAQCLADRTDYSQNAEKTNGGEFISSYECDPETADQEFLLSKRQYLQMTGRTQEHDVIAYQIRQSFKPGEITPEEANEIGYKLAMRFTKGKHAFLVATHIDKAHLHNHIIYNSTTLDCLHKFRDFRHSGLAVQRLSDILCLEHGKSVIQPKPYKERTKRTDSPHRSCHLNDIRAAIASALLKKPKNFEELTALLVAAGFEFKDGRQPALRGKNGDRFIRFRSLGDGYTVEDLKAVLDGEKRYSVRSRGTQTNGCALDLPINIQEKLAAGKGAGYERWAKMYNLKAAAKAVLFLQENGIRTMEQLQEKTEAVTNHGHELLASVKASEKKMAEITALRKHIVNYVKTRETYIAYRKAGYSRKFFEAHREELTIHRAAKEAFDQLKIKKIPKVKELDAEYAKELARKKKIYAEYRLMREEMRNYQIALKVAEAYVRDEDEQKIPQRDRDLQKV